MLPAMDLAPVTQPAPILRQRVEAVLPELLAELSLVGFVTILVA